MSNTLTGKVSGRMSSRGWAIALGIGAVVLAAILLVVYLDRYRARVGGENAPTPVLVAKQLIPQGTPGTLVASQSMYAPTTLPRKEVEVGAISDPAYLSGRAAAADIFPGQQFTATDFAASDTASVDSQITGTQRAFAIVARRRPRNQLAGAGGRLGRRLHRCRRRRKALPAERQGTHDSDDSRPERRRQPHPANRDQGRLDLAVRGRQHVADLRPPPGRRCQADEAVAGECSYGAEVEVERIT